MLANILKGQQIAVVGRLQNRNWDDQNGQKHYATDIIAEEVDFAGSKIPKIVAMEIKQDEPKQEENYFTSESDSLPF